MTSMTDTAARSVQPALQADPRRSAVTPHRPRLQTPGDRTYKRRSAMAADGARRAVIELEPAMFTGSSGLTARQEHDMKILAGCSSRRLATRGSWGRCRKTATLCAEYRYIRTYRVYKT